VITFSFLDEMHSFAQLTGISFKTNSFFLLISTAKQGTLIIDCSTIDVRTSKEMSEMARNKKLRFVDAPVSGG